MRREQDGGVFPGHSKHQTGVFPELEGAGTMGERVFPPLAVQEIRSGRTPQQRLSHTM